MYAATWLDLLSVSQSWMHNHYAVKNLHYKIHKMLLCRSWYTTIEYTRIVILGRAYGGIPGKKNKKTVGLSVIDVVDGQHRQIISALF